MASVVNDKFTLAQCTLPKCFLNSAIHTYNDTLILIPIRLLINPLQLWCQSTNRVASKLSAIKQTPRALGHF